VLSLSAAFFRCTHGKAIACLLVTTVLLDCTTTLVSTRKEYLDTEVVERHAAMAVLSSPSPPEGKISLGTKMSADLVLGITSSEREKRNYVEVHSYRRVLNPVLKYLSLLGGPALLLAGVYGITAGYVVLGEYLAVAGVVAAVPGLTIWPREFEGTEREWEEDGSPMTRPAVGAGVDVVIEGASSRLHFTADSQGHVVVPLDSMMNLCPERDEIGLTVRLSEDSLVAREYVITSAMVSAHRQRRRLSAQAAERRAKEEAEWLKKLAYWVSYVDQQSGFFASRWIRWGEFWYGETDFAESDMIAAGAARYDPWIVPNMGRASLEAAIGMLITNRVRNRQLLTKWGGEDFYVAVVQAIAALYSSEE